MTSSDEQPEPEIIALAERVLTATFGSPMHLDAGIALQERDHVFRCQVLDAPTGMPTSVVIKHNRPNDKQAARSLERFFDDWAGVQFLSEVANDVAFAPRFLGGDLEDRMMVLEDLGTGEGIDAFLLGSDPLAAEQSLIALATTLGRMHARTIGRKDTFDRMRTALGAATSASDAAPYAWLAPALQSVAESFGITPMPGSIDELRTLEVALTEPGPFLAYTHGDPCPDNCLRVGNQIRLIDFEIGAFRHALTDGVYGRIHFPTCWCVNRLPPTIPRRMEAAYRAELITGCPEAADDTLFGHAVVEACAYWALNMCKQFDIPRLLREDGEWGISTVRQRMLLRSEIFAQTTAEFGYLEALGATFAALASHLRAIWPPEADAMPLYPAFRST